MLVADQPVSKRMLFALAPDQLDVTRSGAHELTVTVDPAKLAALPR